MSNANVLAFSTHHSQTSNPRRAKKQVRIIKKIRSDRRLAVRLFATTQRALCLG